MKLHRFYVSDTELTHNLWIHNPEMLHQWNRVLRLRPGTDVVLFDGKNKDALYKIVEFQGKEARLELVTEFERKLPKRSIYLLWSLLKKDKNDWVLQKCTELGVSHFVPLLADRSEKTGFNLDRAEKIVIEASEQCGRSDIPTVREPMHVKTALEELGTKIPLFICEQGDSEADLLKIDKVGILIGPEGGWSDAEKQLFKLNNLSHLNLHDFTLRAETAAITAATKIFSF